MLALLKSYRLAFIRKDLALLPYLFTEGLSPQRLIFSEDTAFPCACVSLPMFACLKGSGYLHLPPEDLITFKMGGGSAFSCSSHCICDSATSLKYRPAVCQCT